MALYLRDEEVRALLSMPVALDALDAAFRAQARGEAVNQPRTRVHLPGITLHVLPAGWAGPGHVGLKAYATTRRGAQFLFLLFAGDTGELLAMMEADTLGQIRTGAASGLATRYMAPPAAAVAGIVGTGWQARSQVEALVAVRPLREIRAFGRDPDRRRRFAEAMSARLGISVRPATSAQEAVEGAAVVVTITNSAEPVLHGEWLAPGVHVNAVGSNSLKRRELDQEAVRRAARVVVDSREQARLEAGDLAGPVAEGWLRWETLPELAEVVAGTVPGRQSAEEITVFKSLGIGLEDVAVASRVYAAARAQGVGQELPGAGRRNSALDPRVPPLT